MTTTVTKHTRDEELTDRDLMEFVTSDPQYTVYEIRRLRADNMRLRKAPTEDMVERALEAANGRMVDTRRFWTDGDRDAVRAMLKAALDCSDQSTKGE